MLMLRTAGGVVIRNQPPAALLLYPYPGKPILARDGFALVLPNHFGEARLHRRVFVDTHLNLVGRDRLKFQMTPGEIRNHLWLGSHCAAWSYADKIISVDTVKGHRISIDLRLNAFIIQLSYRLLDAASLICACARRLPSGDEGRCTGQDGCNECSSHEEFSFSNLFRTLIA